MSMSKDLKQILADAETRGWRPVPNCKNHAKYQLGTSGPIVVVGNTLSDRRALLNVKARFKRAERTGKVK